MRIRVHGCSNPLPLFWCDFQPWLMPLPVRVPPARAVHRVTKHNIVMSRRTHHKPLHSLYNPHTITLCYDRKKNDGQTGSRCLDKAVLAQWGGGG